MRSQNWVRVLVALIVVWFFTPLSASAQEKPVIKGVHYVDAKCPNGKSGCIQLINKKGDQVEADTLASLFGLNAEQLRAKNPKSTIAVCRDPLRRQYWHMAKIQRAEDRATDAVWEHCPEKDRRVVTVPGEILEVGGPDVKTFTSIKSAIDAAMQCGASDGDCVRGALGTIFPDVNSSPSSTDMTALKNPVSPATPPAAPVPPISSPPTDSGSNTPTAQVAVDTSNLFTKNEVTSIVLVMNGIWIIAFILYVWHQYKRRAELRIENGELKEAGFEKDSQLRVKDKKIESDQTRIETLESSVKQFEILAAQHTEEAKAQGTQYQTLMQEKHREAEQARKDAETTRRTLAQFAAQYVAPEQRDQLDARTISQGIEQVAIREIVECMTELYGTSPAIAPRTRDEAWKLLHTSERDWHNEYLSRISAIQSLITSNPPSYSRDPSGFTALGLLRRDIRLCQDVVRDELKVAGLSSSETDDMSLMDLLTKAASEIHVRLSQRAEAADENARTWRQAYLDATAPTKPKGSSDDESEPISKPAKTLPGIPALHLISGHGGRNGT